MTGTEAARGGAECRGARTLIPDERLTPLRPVDWQRYSRTIDVAEVGEAGQQRIRAAQVLLVGAGGLGSPVALYLAACGIGVLGVVDPDVVAVSNLQRQVMHAMDSVGRRKVDSARAALASLNPEVRVVGHPVALTEDNAVALVEGWDLVVDATDGFSTRYLLNDTTARLGLPLVHGAVHGTQGQVTVFDAQGPCYRCLQPEPPAPAALARGPRPVLGVVPGIVGALQAAEVLKLVVGGGSPLVGRVLVVEAWQGRIREVELLRRPGCPTCSRRDRAK